MSGHHPFDLLRLKAHLPPIVQAPDALVNVLPTLTSLHRERVIDLEWDPESGELETIGVGNPDVVVQIRWQDLDDWLRVKTRIAIENLVKTGVTIYHNADADIRKMRENAFQITAGGHACLQDTMLLDAVMYSEEAHDLGDLNRRLGRLPDYKHLAKDYPVEYNAADLVATYWCWKALEVKAAADPLAMTVYRQQSIPFIDLAIEGEEAGVAVDPVVAITLHGEYSTRVEEARTLARAYTGDPLVNLGSPDMMKQLVHKRYGLPEHFDKIDKDKVTLNKDALAALRRGLGTEWDDDVEPTLEMALDNIEAGGNGLLEAKYLYGGAQQRLTHYVLPCMMAGGSPAQVWPRDRIYPELRQHVQATGRHSYVGPALQQMKGATARLIVPDPGTCWVTWDWSQIEVRLLAYLANDLVYLRAYEAGVDIHEMNRLSIFGAGRVSDEVREIQRGFVKRFCFRLHYRGLAKNAGDIPGCRALGLDVKKLVAASEAYLGDHPALPPYWSECERIADTEGLARTFMGRPRRLTAQWPNARRREACNHPMQGGVADIYCTTALRIKRRAPWARLVYGAHDAQTWQAPVDLVGTFLAIAHEEANRGYRVNGHDAVFPAEFKPIRVGPSMGGG